MSNSDASSIQWEGDYYPFGGAKVLNNFLTNTFRFTDYQWDSELGDNYADYREESPVLGRFFSADPIPGDVSNPQSWNRYAYVGNRPTVMTDPQGLFGECVFCAAIPVAGPIIGVASTIIELLGIFGGHHPTFHPNGPPFGRSGAGQDSGPLQGETLGLPNTVRLRPPS